jgi:hypothetical protein
VTIAVTFPSHSLDWSGPAGAVAAILAVLVTAAQVYRDWQREKRQAVARARSAKLIIGAAYASSILEVRELCRQLRRDLSGMTAVAQACSLRDDQQLAIIFQALLTIDATALSDGAQKPVGDAQAALVALRNIITAVAGARSPMRAADRLDDRMATLKTAFESMRGFVPFEIDP